MKNLTLSNEFTTITLLKYTLNICYQCLLTSPISLKVSILDEHPLKPFPAFASFDRLSSFTVLLSGYSKRGCEKLAFSKSRCGSLSTS
jgi:hypothetical protein